MHRALPRPRVGVASAVMGLLLAGNALAVTSSSDEFDEARNFDARVEYNRGISLRMPAVQASAIAQLNRQVRDFAMTWDDKLGVVKTMTSDTGYLTSPAPAGIEPLTAGMRFVNANLAALGLTREDVSSYRITDSVYSSVSGATHIYAQQLYRGIPVDGAALHVNVNRDGRIMSVNNTFVPSIRDAVNVERPAITASSALVSAMGNIGVALASAPQPTSRATGRQQIQSFAGGTMSTEPMTAQLVYLPINGNEVRLAWNVSTMWTPDRQHTYAFNVDAQTGQVWTRSDSTSSASYRVYELPAESPLRASPLPPADGRTLVVDPEDPTASPNGWLLDNNLSSAMNPNVRACIDRIGAANQCDAQVMCADATCDFPLDLSLDPTVLDNQRAAVANVFYIANKVHDIQYKYGFDEVAGNFQEDNGDRGGRGGDNVNVDAQNTGNCNANFQSPADGTNPRMQMFLCDRGNPLRDGDLDAAVIIHEYGHGVSTRQVGGPNKGILGTCLLGQQQAGEGWSDWLGLVYTARPTDTGPQARGTGSYLFAMNADGGTIRDLPYSTDDALNDWTYESIKPTNVSMPHGVGSRWAQAIWEVYWALVDQHGFEADLLDFDVNDPDEAGNKRALFYINEGFKNTACRPSFINNRDGIMSVVMDNFGGEDVCTVWRTFAAFGLGTDARSANNMKASAINGFQVPVQCLTTDPAPQ